MEGAARGLRLALLASAALHAAALLVFSSQDSQPKRHVVRLEPLAAHFAEPAAPVPAKSTPVRKAAAPAPKVIAALPEAKANPVDQPAPAPAPAAPPVAIAAPAAPVVVAPGAPPVQPAPDAATVGQYRVQLIGAAGRFKRYPEAARENNWTGDVLVGVAVGAQGVAQVSVRRSSGHAVLDQQALEMFRQAARAVPVPAAIRGTAFALEVRAIYGLED